MRTLKWLLMWCDHKSATILFATSILVAIAGCGRSPKGGAGGGPPGGAMPPSEVGVVTIAPESIPVTVELPGRVSAFRVAEVRARATGILLKRLFEEGADVKTDQVLYQIDPAPLQAAYDSAKANLARAEATEERAKADARRKETLVKINGVSQQVYEEAKAVALQSQADVLAAKAALQTASLNLGYTKVTAPISGRIGKSLVTEGALVSATEATKLAVILQLDPVYVDFTQSSAEILKLRHALEGGKLQGIGTGEAKVQLILEDGSVYSCTGKLLFSDISVDESTDSVTLRARFDNPDETLLPGMFVRGKVEVAVNSQALAVSQRAVARDAVGQASVLVVNARNQVEKRLIQTESVSGDKWIVSSGLKAGERVIVEGLQKVRVGMTVVPTPFQSSYTNGTQVSASTVSAR
ncbi:MAG: efflux RND transporter periplasmic adaptor subunit [Candidatus Omnitrophica bacterium]|nr:efflux RND transporter periplasmic adaptor subunit [Candidatus Omnitrophota bacterium]